MRSRPRAIRRASTVIIANLVVFCVLAEAAALLVYYYQHGWLFYGDPYRAPLSARPRRGPGTR